MDRGRARHPPRHPAARAPRRHVPVPARRARRGGARPHRVQPAQRHDGGPAGRVRVLRRLRRGGAPLRPRARRHARGAAQARPAVRAHRPGAPAVRGAPVRDRRALRPRPDPGRDVQAAQRLRPRRPRAALHSRAAPSATLRAGDENDTAVARGLRGGHRRQGARSGQRTTWRETRSSCSDRGTSGSSTSWRSRGGSRWRRWTPGTRASSPRCASTPTWAGCWCTRPSTGRSSSAPTGPATCGRPGGGRGPAGRLLRQRRRVICAAATGSPTSRTSWSTASTTHQLDEGCAFEELISFHGGMGGPQTRAMPAVSGAPAVADGAHRRGGAGASRAVAGGARLLQGEVAAG